MIPLKTAGTIALGTVFSVSIFCYSFCQRFQHDAVYTAIPMQASFVFKADNLEKLLQSPVCNQLNNALGAGNSLRELLPAEWINLAATSEIAVADIPFRNAGQNKSWAAVSWVGWRSPWLRWKLEAAQNNKFTLLGKHAVWPVWQYHAPEITKDMTLTLALTDNLFIVCLSENPGDIALLLDTYDKRIPAHKRG